MIVHFCVLEVSLIDSYPTNHTVQIKVNFHSFDFSAAICHIPKQHTVHLTLLFPRQQTNYVLFPRLPTAVFADPDSHQQHQHGTVSPQLLL